MGKESVGEILFLMALNFLVLMDSMNCVSIGTVGIKGVGRDLSIITICREFVCCQQATCQCDRTSAELETVRNIKSSPCHIMKALPRLRNHNLIIVDNLRLRCVCMHVCGHLYIKTLKDAHNVHTYYMLMLYTYHFKS